MPLRTSIRQATRSDAEEICMLWIRSIREICGPLYNNDEKVLSLWCANKNTQQMTEEIADPKNFFIVAEDSSGALAGLGILHESAIRACYVSPESLGKGFGTTLLNTLESEARKRGIKKLELGSSRHAFEFYKHHGYRALSDTELLFHEVIPYTPMEKVIE